ncbi:ankyrin repeat domain-containing protein 61-like [Antedon mediterranea]|uniref:ankyrin repeat domain-containing protein 61-like n=1 Tax=Antedon mediterranea TaxID=105859 RepID=UPI003AF9EFEC
MGNKGSRHRSQLPSFEEDPLKFTTSCILQRRYKTLRKKLKKAEEINWTELIDKRLKEHCEGPLAGLPIPRGLDSKELPLHSIFSMFTVGKYNRTHLRFVKLLVKTGYDPNIKDLQGLTALHHAIQRLLAFDINNELSRKVADAYWYAYKIVDTLCSHGADVNLPHPYTKHNALHLAAKAGLYEAITTLIANGCKVEALDYRKRTPIVVAVENSSAMCVKHLLKYGFANAGVVTPDGHTLLHCAMIDSGWSMSIVQLLVPLSDIDINAKNNRGDTALHIAARRHLDHLIIELIKHGADPDIKNNRGRIPLFEFLDNLSMLSNPQVARVGVGKKLKSSRSFRALVEHTANPSWAIYADRIGNEPNLLSDEYLSELIFVKLNLHQPPDLKHFCRLKIRSCLGIVNILNDKKLIHSIGIPRELEKYICSEKYKSVMHTTNAWK